MHSRFMQRALLAALIALPFSPPVEAGPAEDAQAALRDGRNRRD